MSSVGALLLLQCMIVSLAATGIAAYIMLPPTSSTTTTSLFSSPATPNKDDRESSWRRNPLFGRRLVSSSSRRKSKSTTRPLSSSQSPKPFLIPSLFHSNDSRPILFDGKCNLCNAGVQLILDCDRADVDARGNLRVAALQSQVGRLLLGRLSEKQRNIVFGVNRNDDKNDVNDNKMKKSVEKRKVDDDDDEVEYKSIIVVTPTTTHLNSDACLYIGRELSGPLRNLSFIAGIIPTFIRDVLYKLLSKYRKRLFGSSTECRLWDDNWDTRFVDDSVLTGEKQQSMLSDPFADPNTAVAASTVAQHGDNDANDNARTPLFHAGDMVRVLLDSSSTPPHPIVHTHIPGYNGICTVGSVGTVMRVSEGRGRAYEKNVTVKFELDVAGYDDNLDCDTTNTTTTAGKDATVEKKGSTCTFEAHFFPSQLRKE